DDHFGVAKAWEIVGSWLAVAEDFAQLCHELFFHGGILREEIAGPTESDGGGFVSGEEEGHHFVAELGVAHGGAVRVRGLEEVAQQVASLFARIAAVADDAVDDSVEVLGGALTRWCEEPWNGKREQQSLTGVIQEAVGDDVHGVADALGDSAEN